MRFTNTSGPADKIVQLSIPYSSTGYAPLVGDWDGDGDDSIGVRTMDATWRVRDTLDTGAPTSSFQYGYDTDIPLVW